MQVSYQQPRLKVVIIMVNKVLRVSVVLLTVFLVLYLIYGGTNQAHQPVFFEGEVVEIACGEGRARGRLNIVYIDSVTGKKEWLTTQLFGKTLEGSNPCEVLDLYKYVGSFMVFGETGTSWDTLQFDNLDIHSLDDVKLKIIQDKKSLIWED